MNNIIEFKVFETDIDDRKKLIASTFDTVQVQRVVRFLQAADFKREFTYSVEIA